MGRSYYLLANLSFQTEDYVKAESLYTSAIGFGVSNETVYNNRGKARFNQKNYDGSIEDYSKALEINPEYKKAILNRGTSYYSLRKLCGSSK